MRPRGGHHNWILDWSRRDSQEWIFITQELQNWFRIFCHSNSVLSPTLPTQPTYRLGYKLAGPECELKAVRGTKNPKPVLKFLHNKYSFLRVSPWSVKNSILVPAPTIGSKDEELSIRKTLIFYIKCDFNFKRTKLEKSRLKLCTWFSTYICTT